MFWIYLVILAQFFSAIVTLVDKYLVTSPLVGKPVVYTFYIGAMSGIAVLLLPFGVVAPPDPIVLWLSLAAGVSFVFSTLFLYKSLQLSDASDVAPVFGALSAIATLGFSGIFLGTSLSGNFLFGFLFLVLGTFITSYFHLTKKATLFLIIGGILLGFSSVFLKELLNQTTFWNGFFWSRLASVFGVALLLLWPGNAGAIFGNISSSSAGTKTIVIANKIIAGFAFLMILYAIKLGNVSIVNALGGVQFAFLLLLMVLFAKKFPQYFYETTYRHAILRKTIATSLIAAGLVVLFL